MRLALFGLLGFSAGLPFYMFSTVLSLRLERNGVGIVIIGFFVWVTLLPTLKFLWAPAVDRFRVPGFARYWGKRRGWILLTQLGIVTSMVALGLMDRDTSLPLTALAALLLAFWTTTLEIAADAWRIELYPTAADQGPVVAANLWGYRSAMVAAGSGALILADNAGWIAAYLIVALAAFLPFPMLVATRGAGGGRTVAVVTGLLASAVILTAVAVAFAALGGGLVLVVQALGVSPESNVTPWVLGFCMAPFLALAALVPVLRRAPPDAWYRTSPAIGPYVDIFWRYGGATLALMAFVSLYRMGDVMALALSKLMVKSLGYTLTEIGVADGAIALLSSMAGVALGGWLVTRWPGPRTLALGAVVAAIGNFGFVWLANQPVGAIPLYVATALDQFGNGLAGAVFVVWLSLLVNPRHAGAQYAFLTGFAFLLPRLLGGTSGAIQSRIGYDGFFVLAGALSLAALLVLPFVARLRPRPEDIA